MWAKIHSFRMVVAALGVAMVLILASVTAQAGAIQIPSGTEVKLRFPEGMKLTSGDVTPGVPIVCYLQEPIEIGGVVAVEKDAQATAKVIEVKPAGKGGKPGYIKIGFESLDAKGSFRLVSADKIKLSGEIEAKGKSKKTLSYLFIFGLFIKGSQGAIPADQVYTAKVAESVVLEDGE